MHLFPLFVVDTITDVAAIAFAQKACQTGHCITKVGLSNLCTHDQEGNEFPSPIFPFKVNLEPNENLHFDAEHPASHEEFIDQFKVFYYCLYVCGIVFFPLFKTFIHL